MFERVCIVCKTGDMEFIRLKRFLGRGYLVLSFDIIIYCYRCSDKEKNDSQD